MVPACRLTTAATAPSNSRFIRTFVFAEGRESLHPPFFAYPALVVATPSRHLHPIHMLTVDQLIELEEQTRALVVELENEIGKSEADVAAISPDAAIGRLSRTDAMQQQEMSKAGVRRRQDRIDALHEALRRMDEGTYAICTNCRGTIEFDRLQLAPELKLCAKCSSARG